MGIFDKVKSLFQATEDKKDKTSKIEIDKKKLKIQSKSDPEPGSEYPWHHHSSPDKIFGRNRAFW